MVGRVGADGFGAELVSNLQASGVQTNSVFVDETVSSGVAAIAVDDAGENQIIVIPGANTASIKKMSKGCLIYYQKPQRCFYNWKFPCLL